MASVRGAIQHDAKYDQTQSPKEKTRKFFFHQMNEKMTDI